MAVNARDAMPEGGDLRIRLDRVRIDEGEAAPLPEMGAGEWVSVSVSDSGQGIPPDVLPHIFDPFFTTKEPIGSGLGLAQVHGIVAQHEGQIDVETQTGKGTIFTIYLPALPVRASEPGSRELPVLATGQGETVLVVEDNAAARAALADSIELLGYQVLEAANGRDALAIMDEHPEVALVLSDLVMPNMGGQGLFHALRQQGSTVPVVLLTGHPKEKELEDLRAHGLNGWLLKPPSLEQLGDAVARALEVS
jgi:CheY-like chemotaxis protein